MSIDRKSIPTFVYYSLSFYTVRYLSSKIWTNSSLLKITIALYNFVSSIVLKSFNIRISNDLLELMIYDKTFFNDHGKIV